MGENTIIFNVLNPLVTSCQIMYFSSGRLCRAAECKSEARNSNSRFSSPSCPLNNSQALMKTILIVYKILVTLGEFFLTFFGTTLKPQ